MVVNEEGIKERKKKRKMIYIYIYIYIYHLCVCCKNFNDGESNFSFMSERTADAQALSLLAECQENKITMWNELGMVVSLNAILTSVCWRERKKTKKKERTRERMGVKKKRTKRKQKKITSFILILTHTCIGHNHRTLSLACS